MLLGLVREEEVCAIHHQLDTKDRGARDHAGGKVDRAGGQQDSEGQVEGSTREAGREGTL